MTEEEKKEITEEKTEQGLELEGKALDKMTAPELREIAKEIPGVTGVHAMKKPELLSIIKKSKGIKDERPVKKTTKAAYNIRELKQKLVILKQEKQKALKIRDKNRVNILRRRINRIKKMTRKAASAA